MVEARSCGAHLFPELLWRFQHHGRTGIAKLCMKHILEYGAAAKQANEQQIITPALNRIMKPTSC
jgi:hypothetical protein